MLWEPLDSILGGLTVFATPLWLSFFAVETRSQKKSWWSCSLSEPAERMNCAELCAKKRLEASAWLKRAVVSKISSELVCLSPNLMLLPFPCKKVPPASALPSCWGTYLCLLHLPPSAHSTQIPYSRYHIRNMEYAFIFSANRRHWLFKRQLN